MASDLPGYPNSVTTDFTGQQPEVTPDLLVANRTIGSIDQAFSVCETLVNDWKKGIQVSQRITAKLNGERPYNQAKLKQAAKDWKTNISTGFLATECNRITPRFYMPLKTAKYLTAASLPAGYPNGEEKSNFFRQSLTDTIRAWPKFNFYIRGMAREVGVFGFCFNAWFDEYEWRPTLMRMDKGFVPQGTEVMELEPPFFMAKWDYKPNELLELLKANQEVGLNDWRKDACVKAINAAQPPPADASYPNVRSYEELIRQSAWMYTYQKGAKVIRTYHLFAKETTGKVSHYVLLAEGQAGTNPSAPSVDQGDKLLFEKLDQYESMQDAFTSTVFDYGDGTIHGSWGAGQILYDLSVQVEKVRCDSIDNIRMTNRLKLNVPDAKNANDVKLSVNDQFMLVTGAQFAGNSAGIGENVGAYGELDMRLTQLAQEKIGAFVPPIPLQPSDIKAAQVNAAMMKERELQEALLENWLIQIAVWVHAMTRRLLNPNTPDPVAKSLQELLLTKLTPDEIAHLASQPPVKSVMDFTEFAVQTRGMFVAC